MNLKDIVGTYDQLDLMRTIGANGHSGVLDIEKDFFCQSLVSMYKVGQG